MLPFVWNKTLWMSGIAGSIPSMVAYIVGTLGIFRLVSARAGRVAAYIAAGIYALNPNLLYMQSTAMNEPLYLAFLSGRLCISMSGYEGCRPRARMIVRRNVR